MKNRTLTLFVADAADIPMARAKDAMKGIVRGVRDALKRGESLTLYGLGTFRTRRVSAQLVSDFGNGRRRVISSHRKICFRPSASFRNAIK